MAASLPDGQCKQFARTDAHCQTSLAWTIGYAHCGSYGNALTDAQTSEYTDTDSSGNTADGPQTDHGANAESHANACSRHTGHLPECVAQCNQPARTNLAGRW